MAPLLQDMFSTRSVGEMQAAPFDDQIVLWPLSTTMSRKFSSLVSIATVHLTSRPQNIISQSADHRGVLYRRTRLESSVHGARRERKGVWRHLLRNEG